LEKARDPSQSDKDAEVPKVEMAFADNIEQHRLFVAKRNDNYELMVASAPKLLKEYIVAKSIELKDTDKESDFKEILKLIEQYNSVSSGYKNNLGKRLMELMEAAVKEIGQVGTGDGKFDYIPPKTEVEWGATKLEDGLEVGTSMKANPLSIDPGGLFGSEPSGGYGNSYVKGHLLNHHLHGPAVPKNLTPMSSAMNTAFEKNVENFMKQKVISENRVFSYTVIAEDFDGSVPGKIAVKAQELEPNPDDATKWQEKDKGWTIKGEVDQDGECSAKPVKDDGEEPMEIGSDPSLLTDFIDDASNPANVKLEALEIDFKKIQYEWSEEFGKYLRDILQVIVSKLVTLFPKEHALFPKSKIEYGPTTKFKNDAQKGFRFSDEHGTWMKAELLSIDPGEHYGYEPQTERWGNLVQGHLLNHHLHGPAESKNLVPISSSLNKDMESNIESIAKELVLEKNRVVYYKVWADKDVKVSESEILLGKEVKDDLREDELPSTPLTQITKLDKMEEEMGTLDEKAPSYEEKLEELEQTKDKLFETYAEEEEKYAHLQDYYVPAGLKAVLQPLKLKKV
jgi:hypothetical protein